VSRAGNELSIPFLAGVIVAAGLLLWAGSVALQAWFHGELAEEHARKVVEQPVVELEQQLETQRAALTDYRWVDREAGVVRLPIDRAIELVADEDGERRQ
jgi:uncharacterized protein YdgA (DUF945 family)